MPCNYQELEIKSLEVAATLCEPKGFPGGTVSLEDPAIKVMTDLKIVSAVTISPSCTLDEATDRMLKLKVKLLFVTDSKNRIIGLITYSDIQGERPIQFQQANGVSRSEICVLDIMTGIETIDAIDWSVIEKSRVGDIAMTMRKLNRQHALVLEHPSEDIYQIRGIFSISLLSKSLGINIETTEVAQTFAEFERVLGCGT
ncbi:MAG: CBS domain-containing protein [Gammaproteobacteria bacterium]|nr:CBS domain-containing protein [Gammaproteobacteria bacterium]